MFRRIILFLATNLLVIATISIVTSVLGLHTYLNRYGIDYVQLAIFCAIWGTGGAFISLFMSKFIAKMAMGVVIINPNNATREERFLLEMIYELAKGAGLKTMPEVGIYSSPEVNAFATGPSRANSLIAVSSGLLANMNRDEVQAVLAHEISHVANGDMVTMTLVQGVVNAFALFLSRIIAYAISVALSRSDDRGEISYMTFSLFAFVFDILFTLLGSILVAAYSRWREYRADRGGARLAGRDRMIAALRRLQQTSEIQDERAPSLAAFKISHRPSWMELFSSHPPLKDRIARLQQLS
ncbi:MAG: protease HtpX [Gammaproteobacteria bacterium]|nr:protease HtpX [Gammaproteobacteria bacterium]